jgi:hydroxymethylpyrimidine/phosphomethylpyrimidine kinase
MVWREVQAWEDTMSPPIQLSPRTVPAAMTIAGSDSGGGAGIQADLKTFAALGVYGTSAITAVTAQNTLGVRGFVALDPAIVVAQIEAVMVDIAPRAVKTGMLANAGIVRAVGETLRDYPETPLVIDPVTHAKSGDALLADDAVAVLRDELLPLATVITPNLPEAASLTGLPIENTDDMHTVGLRLLELGVRAVIVKGGHLPSSVEVSDDLYLSWEGAVLRAEWLRSERIVTRCTHGTGCTFSAAIAAGIARGLEPLEAARQAKTYLTDALRAGYEVGAGHSPVNHFHHIDAFAPQVQMEGLAR